MKNLILYPVQKKIFNTIQPLYEISSGCISHVDMLSVEVEQLDNLDNLRQNLLLDFQIALRSFYNSTDYIVDLLELKDFFSQQKADHYSIGDYLFYCLVFNKDIALQEQVTKHILAMSNEYKVTLSTYINLNGNTMRAAKHLYMHRNSLMYRLEKIEQSLQLDLSDTKVIHSCSIILMQLNI